MSVKGRLRFEVLRRDGHTCRYCGGKAPDVRLTIDHVIPRSLGGTDAPENLVTACTSCNGGKSSIAPDAALVADVEEKELNWRRAISRALEARREETANVEADTAYFGGRWDAWGWGEGDDRRSVDKATDWDLAVHSWLRSGLTVEDLVELIPESMRRTNVKNEAKWRYYCGIVRNVIAELHLSAKDIMVGGDGDVDYPDEPACCDCGNETTVLLCLPCAERAYAPQYEPEPGERYGEVVQVGDALLGVLDGYGA